MLPDWYIICLGIVCLIFFVPIAFLALLAFLFFLTKLGAWANAVMIRGLVFVDRIVFDDVHQRNRRRGAQ